MEIVKIFKSLEEANKMVLPQSIRLLKIGEKRICLINQDNNFHAIDDKCPHMGAPLHQGKLNGFGEVICPLHEYRFNVQTGTECASKCDDVKNYKVIANEEGVFIELPV